MPARTEFADRTDQQSCGRHRLGQGRGHEPWASSICHAEVTPITPSVITSAIQVHTIAKIPELRARALCQPIARLARDHARENSAYTHQNSSASDACSP